MNSILKLSLTYLFALFLVACGSDGDNDTDDDGILNDVDNCVDIANADQNDLDGDGEGDVCDTDLDGDGVDNEDDNSPNVPNPNQED